MNPVSSWTKQSNLASKLFMGLAIAGFVVVINKMWIKPYVTKQRYKRAEAWAQTIIENEERELNNE